MNVVVLLIIGILLYFSVYNLNKLSKEKTLSHCEYCNCCKYCHK